MLTSRYFLRRVCPIEPKRHFHRTVQVNSSRKFRTSLVRQALDVPNTTQTAATVCLKWSHTKLKTHSKRLTIIGLSVLRFGWLVARCNIAKQLQRPCLMCVFLIVFGDFQRTFSENISFF